MFSLLTSRALSTARVVTVSPFKKQFALSAISETFPPEINVKLAPAHERPLFSYSSNDAAPNTPSTPSTPSTTPSRFEYQIEPMQTSQFLIDCAEQSLIPPPPIPFTHYFTAILTSPAYVSFLRANFSDWRAVLSPHHAPSPAKLSPSIWIGGTGTTTTLHYDVSDNVLTNVLGKKRVRVYSPASHKTFNVFPDSDPRARKAQIPLDEVSGWEALQPIVDVVIEEGVGVFIPAFYLHECEVVADSAALDSAEADSVSVSLNAFAASPVGDAASKLLGVVGEAVDVDEESYAEIVRGVVGLSGVNLEELKVIVLKRYGVEEVTAGDGGGSGSVGSEVASAWSELVKECSGDCGGVLEIVAAHVVELLAVKATGGEREREQLVELIQLL